MKKILFGFLALSIYGTAIASCSIYDQVVTTDEALRAGFNIVNVEEISSRTVNHFGEVNEAKTEIYRVDGLKKTYDFISSSTVALNENGLLLSNQKDQADYMILLDTKTKRNLGFYFGIGTQEYSKELLVKVITKGSTEERSLKIQKASKGFDEGLKKTVIKALKSIKGC